MKTLPSPRTWQALLVLTIGLLAPALSASAVKQLTLEELCEHASVIVRATVTESEAKWDDAGASIWTHYALDVHATLKGEFAGDYADAPEAHGKGGVVGQIGQAVSGEPTLTLDAEYLLFLWHDADNDRYRLLGKPQGVFAIERPAKNAAGEQGDGDASDGSDDQSSNDAQARVSNSFSGVQVLDDQGQPVGESEGRISATLEELTQSISDHVSAQNEADEAELEHDASGEGDE